MERDGAGVARESHKLQVASSNLAPASNRDDAIFRRWHGVFKALAKGPSDPYPAYHEVDSAKPLP